MTHQEKLFFIISKIHEALPEIKELKFGCEFIDKEDGKSYTIVYRNDVENNTGIGKNEVWSVPDYNKGYIADWRLEMDEYYEIIGRKIGIADVLLVIDRERVETRTLMSSPDTITFEKVQFGKTLIGDWDLKNDDITKQSESAVNFLYDLLKD